ncbi:MAG: YigZ family protein [Thermoplasmata archaeon]|nr:YigZ family protein [Thermoplasmata archaeon]
MEEIASIKVVVQRSRFFAHIYEITSADEIILILKLHRSRYRKANHHCYGMRLRDDGDVSEVQKDDGEVGHPGKVILEIMRREGLDHHVLIISRVFGGVKLGVGGVSRAFREAGSTLFD